MFSYPLIKLLLMTLRYLIVSITLRSFILIGLNIIILESEDIRRRDIIIAYDLFKEVLIKSIFGKLLHKLCVFLNASEILLICIKLSTLVYLDLSLRSLVRLMLFSLDCFTWKRKICIRIIIKFDNSLNFVIKYLITLLLIFT